VSAVDAPPGIGFGGRAAGEFVARPASLKLARRALVFVVAASALALFVIGRRRLGSSGDLLIGSPLVAVAIAVVGYAVRRARLRIDGDGVRWGWDALGFRVPRDKLAGAVVYTDAVAFRRGTSTPWYLARHDFAEFDRVPAALRQAGIGFEQADRRAPLRARLQTYGVALDVLLILDVLFAAAAVLFAVARVA
jgi:hypothetical protein